MHSQQRIVTGTFLSACLWGVCCYLPVHAQESLLAVEVQNVDFGLVPVGTSRCTMDNNGGVTGGCLGSYQLGLMQVTGEPFFSYSVSVSGHGWVNNSRFRPELTPDTYILNNSGSQTVSITGNLQLKNAISAGAINLAYTFTVNYQ